MTRATERVGAQQLDAAQGADFADELEHWERLESGDLGDWPRLHVQFQFNHNSCLSVNELEQPTVTGRRSPSRTGRGHSALNVPHVGTAAAAFVHRPLSRRGTAPPRACYFDQARPREQREGGRRWGEQVEKAGQADANATAVPVIGQSRTLRSAAEP
jgi:hypothetical protein